MVMRVTGAVIVPIILLATAAALFRVYTAPDRIQKGLKVAREVCERSGGLWVIDADRAPICKHS